MKEYGYADALKYANVSEAQLIHWNRRGVIVASVRQARGKGSQNIYSYEDLVCIAVAGRLARRFGTPVEALRQIVQLVRAGLAAEPRAEVLHVRTATDLDAMVEAREIDPTHGWGTQFLKLARATHPVLDLGLLTREFRTMQEKYSAIRAWWCGTMAEFIEVLRIAAERGGDTTGMMVDLRRVERDLQRAGATP